jgi:type III secretion system (T3SS) SseB-like protein
MNPKPLFRKVRPLGEQNGPVERDLKAQITPLLRAEATIKRAYLCRATYDPEPEVNVVLCLIAPEENLELIQHINRVFASIFASAEHLDIAFINEAEEAEIGRVCRPFYAAR